MSKGGTGAGLRAYFQLGKIRISIPVALTGFLGYFRADGVFDLTLLFTILGIFLMSMGSSAINQIQERETDRRMKRTADRPLPSGRVSLPAAIAFSILTALGGLVLLYVTGHWMAPLLGLITLAWYNGLYTPLKRVTAFAVVPGAVIGALPPMIGWSAAGGSLLEPEIILISAFLFIGQMPHYWLLMIKVGKEFQDAGLPVITQIFNSRQLQVISYTWIAAAAIAVAVFPATGVIQHHFLMITVLALIMLFLVWMFHLVFQGEFLRNWRKAFMAVNLFYLFIILLLIADKFAEDYLYLS